MIDADVRHTRQGAGPTVVVSQTDSPSRAVIYLHGWRTTAARDVDRHGLGQKALRTDVLIAPTASERSRFGAFEDDIIDAAQEAASVAGVPFPDNVVIVAHSGAYRAAARALDDPRLSGVALLDATYGEKNAYLAALRGGLPMYVATARRSEDTQPIAEQLKAAGAVANLRANVTHDGIVPALFQQALASLGSQGGAGAGKPVAKPQGAAPSGSGGRANGGFMAAAITLVGVLALAVMAASEQA